MEQDVKRLFCRDASTNLKDSPVIRNESYLVKVSGVEIALDNTEVFEVSEKTWTTFATKENTWGV